MAKDGTNRGGARIGAGQKKKPLADKILEGNPGVFCKRNFLTFAKIFPQAPVGKFYVNPSNFSSKISYV